MSRIEADSGRFRVTCAGYIIEFTPCGPPLICDSMKIHAALVDEIDLNMSDTCCVAVRRCGEPWPFFLVAESYSPAGGGFDPGWLLVPDTKMLLVSAGERILAYQLDPPKRLWEDTADTGVLAWKPYGGTWLPDRLFARCPVVNSEHAWRSTLGGGPALVRGRERRGRTAQRPRRDSEAIRDEALPSWRQGEHLRPVRGYVRKRRRRGSTLGLIPAMVAALCFPACVNSRKVRCNTSYAHHAGYQDAREGEATKPTLSEGQICKKKYSFAQFQTDYEIGFSRGVSEVCTRANAHQRGADDGNRGREDLPSSQLLRVCGSLPEFASLNQAYQNAFLSTFCAAERVRSLAHRDASAFTMRSPETVFRACGESLPGVSEVYHQQFYDSIRQQCTPARIYTRGFADVNAGIDPSEGASRLELCPKEDQLQLLRAYQGGYRDAILAAAEQRAQAEAEEQRQREQRRAEEQRLREQRRAARISQRMIKVNGQDVFVQCMIENGAAHITAANPGRDRVNISSGWTIQYFSDAQVFISLETEMRFLTISGGRSDDFSFTAPTNARYCIADVAQS